MMPPDTAIEFGNPEVKRSVRNYFYLMVAGLFAGMLGFPATLASAEAQKHLAKLSSDVELAADAELSAGVPADPIASFTLPNVYGKQITLPSADESPIVVTAFLGTECPLAKLYGKRLAELSAEFADRGVRFVGISSNQQDSLTELAAYKQRYEIPFPLLKDNGAKIADLFDAERTPEVFVLDAQRRVRYRGRIDDQYGVGYVRDQTTETPLRDAVEHLLAGKPVTVARTEAIGCIIGRPTEADENSEVTYTNQIARVLQRNCVECHRAGEIAPFALTDYQEVAGWAEMIHEVVQEGRMPPWHAEPNPAFYDGGHYQGERLMSAEDKRLIAEWVQAGAPEGDPADLPEPQQYVSGWRLPGQPDQVIPMRSKPFNVPAEGVIEYQYFAADPKFTEDRWVQAADIVPGERSVVHHVIVFVSPPVEEARRGLGWLTAYVPGQSSMILPKGQARLVPAGSKFIFQMHYTPTGSAEQDLTKLGLVFADEADVEEEVITQYAVNADFEIPPHASAYKVRAKIDHFPPTGRLLGTGPHMHVRGKSFKFTGVWPTGTNEPDRQVVLDVPRYDFNWQHNYRLLNPIETKPGFAIECEAVFDNSAGNLVNPDPSASVRWGDQTFEEMMIAFFEVAVPKGTQLGRSLRTAELTSEAVEQAQRTADDLFARFDRDRDGQLRRDELPDAFALFAFNRYDADGDKVITSEEAFEAALARARRG